MWGSLRLAPIIHIIIISLSQVARGREVFRVHNEYIIGIIESVDSISRDERDVPLTQYITNA